MPIRMPVQRKSAVIRRVIAPIVMHPHRHRTDASSPSRDGCTHPAVGCAHPLLERAHTWQIHRASVSRSQASVGWLHPRTLCLYPCSAWMRASVLLAGLFAGADHGSSGRTPRSSPTSVCIGRMPMTLLTVGHAPRLDRRAPRTHSFAPSLPARVGAMERWRPSRGMADGIGSSGPGFRLQLPGIARTRRRKPRNGFARGLDEGSHGGARCSAGSYPARRLGGMVCDKPLPGPGAAQVFARIAWHLLDERPQPLAGRSHDPVA
jgi:hypothetical protein